MNQALVELIGYQRAEFARAAALRMWMIAAQVAVVVPAIASVFVDDPHCVLLLAATGVLALLVWLYFERRYSERRRASGRARRATLIMGGLGQPISGVELLSIRELISVSEADAKPFQDPDYFSSKAVPGRMRLGEMLQESAFWTSRMQRESARVMWAAFLLSIIVAAFAFTVVVSLATEPVDNQVARVVLAIVTLLMSTDILGSAVAHSEAASLTDRIVSRLADAEGRAYPEADVLLILSDYNAVVESTPIAVPGLYRLHQARLNRLFVEFQRAREAVAALGP